MAKKFDKNSNDMNATRSTQEAVEGMPDVKVNAPTSRFQDEQQVNTASTTNSTTVPESGFIKKKTKIPGSVLKQEVMASVVKGVGGNGGETISPVNYGLRSLEYSGDGGTISGGAADTPIMRGDFQGKTRADKRLSDPNKQINFIASEQIEVEYDNIPPLSKSDSTVGYNGNPKNVNVRTQKCSGASPAEILYDRSLDIISEDCGVFACGQVVKQNGVEYLDYPTETVVYDASTKKITTKTFDIERGNYAPRNIVVKLSKSSSSGSAFVKSFEVEEDDLSANHERSKICNSASTNEKIFMNQSELTRQRIDSKCGSPTQEHFNPLGRSISEETQTVGFLRDIEASTGATMFTAYKMANKARAYYLFRTAKDGQDLVNPAIEALYGHLMAHSSEKQMRELFDESKSSNDTQSPFKNTRGLMTGSAAIMLPLFDSWGKYKTKADIINQARGLKLAYQTADNNINPFRVDKHFVAALNSIDVFSTIDRNYDPMNAICATDGVRLIYPYSWAKTLKYTRTEAGAERVYDDTLFAYKYSAGNGQNQYIVKCADPVLNGVAYFIEMHADEIYSALGGVTGDVTWTIPTIHYGLHFGLWDQLLMASTPYIIYERTNTMKDILDYEVNFEYPYDNLITIANANPLNAVNYRNVSPFEPLIPMQMKESAAIGWIMTDNPQYMGAKGYMMPYYFSEDEINAVGTSKTDLALMETGSRAFTTVVLRSGARLGFLDDLLSMDPKAYQLCLDRQVRSPFIQASIAYRTTGALGKGVIYKYSQDSEGIPVYTDVTSLTNVTAADYLATPRQLGWFFHGINGWAKRSDICGYTVKSDFFSGPADLTTLKVSDRQILPSHLAIEYKGVQANDIDQPVTLDPASIAVNRSQSFTQCFFMAHANGNVDEKFDIALNVGEVISAALGVTDEAKYSPFVFASEYSGESNVYDELQLVSIHKQLWGLIQKTPFILSPFNCSWGYVDPFMISYIFGLAGFMAADYNEEEYNRISMVLNQGFGYTEDPFVADSPIFKDANIHTEIG